MPRALDPEVLRIAESAGYRLDKDEDGLEATFRDPHGCILTRRKLSLETPEALSAYIARVHAVN